jgi:DNA repair protein RadD
MNLRPYQREAVDAVWHHLRERDDNPVVVIPTGGGKTPVMAEICRQAVEEWNGRVLILAHVKELIEQSVDKLKALCPKIRVGINSAGLGRRDRTQSVIVAGIQSVFRDAGKLDAFDLILVDEAHMIPPEGDGRYRQFLADSKLVNPNVRIIGLTATPYRMSSGMICSDDGYLNHVCYEIGVRELIVQGFLSKLITKNGLTRANTDDVSIRGGEFVASDLEQLMDRQELVYAACEEIVEHAKDRRSVLIFSSGIQHGLHIKDALQDRHSSECGFVCGSTPDGERERTLARFKAGSLKFLCNVNVLTTGFDAPATDCVVMLRPTMSAGLYYQMVGRGFRLADGKENCLVLDFGGNILRHGPVDAIQAEEKRRKSGEPPAKECPSCHSVIACGYANCPDCGHEFPPPERKRHDHQAAEANILTVDFEDERYEVHDINYSVHVKRDAKEGDPRTMRVDYLIGLHREVSEWICVEHDGFAQRKARSWWTQRSWDDMPTNAEEAVERANNGALAHAEFITVRTKVGVKYPTIVAYELGPKPEKIEHDPAFDKEMEVPF